MLLKSIKINYLNILLNFSRHCEEYNVLGFHCEYIEKQSKLRTLKLRSLRSLCLTIGMKELIQLTKKFRINDNLFILNVYFLFHF